MTRCARQSEVDVATVDHTIASNRRCTSTPSLRSGCHRRALASRLKVNRTVDGATPTRRAISLSPIPAVLKRSTSRTWCIVVLSAGIRSPVQKPKEQTLNGPAEAPPNRGMPEQDLNHSNVDVSPSALNCPRQDASLAG
jgi:hypothetical protein